MSIQRNFVLKIGGHVKATSNDEEEILSLAKQFRESGEPIEIARKTYEILYKTGGGAEHPCRNCIYFPVCGDTMRTSPCKGRQLKRRRKRRYETV